MKSSRVEIVKQYLETFKVAGNIPDQQRMMEDLYLINKFIEDGGLHKIERHARS